MGVNAQEKEIQNLQELLSQSLKDAREQYDFLMAQKNDSEETYEKQLKLLAEQQHEELELKRTEYNNKMLDDAERYQILQTKQEFDQNAFAKSQQAVYEEHTAKVNMN